MSEYLLPNMSDNGNSKQGKESVHNSMPACSLKFKIESSNKFSKAVFFGNSSEFTVATAEEQDIANNSKRLIQNAIILWNYMFITKKLQQASEQTEKDEILKALKNSSIIIYFHINLHGIYNFQSYSKRIHNLITLNESKGFMNATGLEK